MEVKPRRRVVAPAVGLYAVWVAATYLLEGYPRTLLRPEATGLRVAYALVANVAVGIAGGAWAARWLVRHADANPGRLGFHGPARALAAGGLGLALGLLAYRLLGPAAIGPVTLANLFAQTLVVSAAEVVVCWVVLGGAVETVLRPVGGRAAVAGMAAASVAFGAYHFAHSPPFNPPASVAFLTGVGLLTGMVSLATRDVYGTVVFHNGLALVGVAGAAVAGGRADPDDHWQVPLIVMALLAGAALAACHRLWLWPGPHTGRAG